MGPFFLVQQGLIFGVLDYRVHEVRISRTQAVPHRPSTPFSTLLLLQLRNIGFVAVTINTVINQRPQHQRP